MDSCHEPERQKFLAHILEDLDDEFRRLVYADWLEEHGEYEEATRQRKWKESKDWLVGFCKEWNFFDCTGEHGDIIYHEEYNDDRRYEQIPGKVLSGKEILERLIKETQEDEEAREWGRYLVAEGIDLHSVGELGGDDKLFWQHMEVVVGRKFKDDHKDKFGWSCTC